MTTFTSLEQLRAQSCAPQKHALDASEVAHLQKLIPDWHIENDVLVRAFKFGDYHATLTFVNTIAPMIHAQDHHPDLLVTFNRCTVRYSTHSVNDGKGGLSINDFICAARIDALHAATH